MEADVPVLTVLSSLDDPVRRRLYEFVAGSQQPVGRDDAATATGIGRPLAAYHLDKLVGLGLLTASYRRPAGRAGPGAGRPAKVYVRAQAEFTVTVPPRAYELAARLLAAAVQADEGGTSRAALQNAARRFGAQAAAGVGVAAGADAGVGGGAGGGNGACDTAGGRSDEPAAQPATAALRAQGFEPSYDPDGTIRLRNCPFHQLAAQHRDVICGMNLALIDGLIAGLGSVGLRAVLDPRPGCCCVAICADAPAGDHSPAGAS